MTAKSTKKTVSSPAVAHPETIVFRSRKRRRAAARENPQAFPEVSNNQLLRDLEDIDLDEQEEGI